jgi:hypothetical protein
VAHGARRSGCPTPGGIGLGALATIARAGCSGSPSFPTGTNTAAFTWHSVDGTATAPNPSQPFSGTVAGIPVRGDSVIVFPPSTPNPGGLATLPAHVPFARWTGSFEGHRFWLTVSFNFPKGFNGYNLAALSINVDGTFGSQTVRCTAAITPHHPDSVTFRGTVGRHHVTGTVRPIQHGAADSATATFTVTG